MGNKLNTRRRSTTDVGDDVTRRRRRKPTRAQSASDADGRSKRVSMPELGGAVPYRQEEEPQVNIKVYRSYGDLARPKSGTLDRPDYRVYRKSTEGLQKYASLPRHFGRSKSAVDVPNGTLRDDVRRRRDLTYDPDYPEIMPRRRSPPDSVSSHSSLRVDSQRTSKRVSAASSVNSLAKAPVTRDDFPRTEQIKRKLRSFEDQFARSLADKYAGLADTLQLSALAIALSRYPDGSYRLIRLLDYLEGDAVPLDLLSEEDPERYVLMTPESLFHGLMHVRRERISDLDLWTSLARELVTCVAVEAANELSRMYEYQIGLLSGETAVRVLADHAAACVIEHIKRSGTPLDRNSAIGGVLRGARPDHVTAAGPRYLSAVVGNRELKWEVDDVLKKPGLREESLLFSSAVGDPDDLGSPWRYRASADCNPELFGYRGPLLEWDWIRNVYTVGELDWAASPTDPDDFHRLYSPYRVLIGDDVMMTYAKLVTEGRTDESLAEFVRRLIDSARDEIRPVYRPLVATPDGRRRHFGAMRLDDVDLARARLRSADLSRVSLRNSTLLLADLEGATFRSADGHQAAPLAGSDLSYTSLDEASLSHATLEGATVRHVLVTGPDGRQTTATMTTTTTKKNKKPDGRRSRPDQDLTDGLPDAGIQTNKKSTRRVPKTLDIRTETNGLPVSDTAERRRPDGNGDVINSDTMDLCRVSDSRGNLMNIEQANYGDKKRKGDKKAVKKAEQARNTKGLAMDTDVGQPISDRCLIEEKQKKVRERRKKVKKRPVSPVASTPTEPIPETTVVVQDQRVVDEQRAPPVVENQRPRGQDERRENVDPTEEFFKDSQPQYDRARYGGGGRQPARTEDTTRTTPNGHRVSSIAEGSGQEENEEVGASAGQQQQQQQRRRQQQQQQQPQPRTDGQPVVEQGAGTTKVKKRAKRGDKVKADKVKADKVKGDKVKGDKVKVDKAKVGAERKRNRSSAKAPDKAPSDRSPVNGTEPGNEPGTEPGTANFRAIDSEVVATAAAFDQRSPGKALSTTNIHQQHQTVGALTDVAAGGQILGPRMTKSLSHHGDLASEGGKLHNLSLDSHALGLRTARQIYGLSKEEIEYITRSQIFNMIKGLQVENIESNLPEVDEHFMGREQERDDVVELLSSPGHVVTVTGCYGIGKSALATSVGHEMRRKSVVPIVIDVRGCMTAESVTCRLTSAFGLRFGYREIGYLYNWLSSHEQNLLFIVDNLDTPADEDWRLSELIDGLVSCVDGSRVLCLCRRNFFRGGASHEVYRLGDGRSFGDRLIARLLPDLHDDGSASLLEACAANCYVLMLVAGSFFVEDVDAGRLFEELVDGREHPLCRERLADALHRLGHGGDDDVDELTSLSRAVLVVLDNMPLEYVELLENASQSPSPFDARTAAALADRADVEAVERSLDELAAVGLLLKTDDDRRRRYDLPSLVRLVCRCKLLDDAERAMEYCKKTMDKVKTLCADYHSRRCRQATEEFADEFDRFVDVFGRLTEREDVYETCPDFGSLEYALFLTAEKVPDEVYLNFYESLAQEAENGGDPLAECRALCCLSHRLAVDEGSLGAAKHAVDRAYELVHDGPPEAVAERAFCLRCMAEIVWRQDDCPADRDRALMLANKSLELYKRAHGSRHPCTIHATELYARLLTARGRHQTARHFYNVSDLFVGETIDPLHPSLVDGYDCRRLIWDGLGLFQRATDAATRAVEASRAFLGQHPTTARMLTNLCDAVVKRGVLQDAIRAAVEALSIRSKVLGDDELTGQSYKKLAYLMLRSGQYDEAARFAQSAIDVFDKVRAPEAPKLEARKLIEQARLRLECKSHVYVELHGRDASKKDLNETGEDLRTSRPSTALSTEV